MIFRELSVYVYLLIINYFISLAKDILEASAKSKMLAGRKRTAQDEDKFLIHQEPNPTWGKGRILNEKLIVKAICGDTIPTQKI